MSRLGFKSVVYHGEVRLGELDVIPVTDGSFRFPNDEIRIHHVSPLSERCPPLSILQTVSSFSVRCKLESSCPVEQTDLTNLHASCFYELKTAVVLLGDEEIHLVAMPSKQKKFPCFWCYSVSTGLYDSCLRLLNMRCLAIVFDLDETLIVANTMKSFEDRIEALRSWIVHEIDPMRRSGMSAELKRYVDDRILLKQYIESDCVVDNGKMFKVQQEEVQPLSVGHEKVIRPVIRLPEKNVVLTRINPEIRDTSVLVRLRPAWEDLRSYLTAKGRKRFEVYVCTMAERDYALEMWRLLDPEANLISPKQLLGRVVCVKSGSKKSLLNVFQDGLCHPKMAMVIDDRSKVWEDKDQPRVHVVPAFTPYYAPQAETANAVPVLCVARNVACNVRGYFFKDFDECLLRSISEVFYENEVVNLPVAPDVSNYLMTEDAGFSSNGNTNAPMSEGMSGAEVERRLKQSDEKGAAGSHVPTAANSSELRPEASNAPGVMILNAAGTASVAAPVPSQKPSLLGVPRRDNNCPDGGRFIGVRPGLDVRNQSMGQPPLLSRLPAHALHSSVQQLGGWLVEEDNNKPVLGARPLGINQGLVSHNMSGSSGGILPHAFHLKNEEVLTGSDLRKQVPPVSQTAEIGGSQNHSNHVSSNGKEFQLDGIKCNGLSSHLFISVLQEIGRRCGSKVEFKFVGSTSKDLEFSVEVLFTGEKIGVGMGKTRKDAQQQAAENALHSLAEKYLAYVSPLSGVTDRDQKNENGFLWDTVNPGGSDDGLREDALPNENASEVFPFTSRPRANYPGKPTAGTKA